jgi:hypothetical protein
MPEISLGIIPALGGNELKNTFIQIDWFIRYAKTSKIDWNSNGSKDASGPFAICIHVLLNYYQ